MEQSVLELLGASQLPESQPRMAAELQLKGLYENEAFPSALVTIGAHKEIPVNNRLAALISLKNLVETSWSPSLDDYAGNTVIGDEAKAAIRDRLLAIVYDGGDDSKITSQTAAVVSKIAKSDFPEEWPGLLESLLNQVQRSSDDQIQGILVVLGELISGALDEDQFYRYANVLVNCLHGIATDGHKKLMVRAHAISIFRSCFDLVENLRDKEGDSIRVFAEGVCRAWTQFFLHVIEEPMPTFPSDHDEATAFDGPVSTTWRGVVAMKLQVVLTLAKIQSIFPDIMPGQDLFNACWTAIQSHGAPYYASYVDGDRQGALINQYQIPYTIDFLVLEEIDFLQILLEAPQVIQQLDGMLSVDKASNGHSVDTWITSIVGTLITFSCITKEAEDMWAFDFNIFLSEETFPETTNSPRNICAGFIWKICSWFPQQTLGSLVGSIKAIFDNADSPWRQKEAALFMIQQVAGGLESDDRTVEPILVKTCIEYIASTMTDGQEFLRARGHIAMAALMGAWAQGESVDNDLVFGFAKQAVQAMDNDASDIVKTACIRIVRDYLTMLPGPRSTELQAPVVASIVKFLDSQDFQDTDQNIELVDVVLQTLRDTIIANPLTCLDHNALDVLLTMVKYGAARDDHSPILIDEAFEAASEAMAKQGPDSYARLCQKVLPSLMAAFDVEDPASKKTSAMTDVACNVLKILAENAVHPLPPGFISSAMPRLCRLIFSDVDFYTKQSATLTIKDMLVNDKDQFFSYVDPQLHKNGLEMCFLVVGHLLSPSVGDAAAAEVGELAVSIVEQAGATMGASMQELLQIIASRLSTAEHLGFIQSLVMVFARLSLLNAVDVVNFLANLPVGHSTALEIVVRKWLENAATFVGFDAVRQSAQALVAIYHLHDQRIAAIQVQGDLVPDTSTRIRTRSMAKSRPIEHTVVPAYLKLVKVLVNELLQCTEPRKVAMSPAGFGAIPLSRSESDESWESEDSGPSFGQRLVHDDTQKYLIEFLRSEGGDPRFQELYASLTHEERTKAMNAVEGYQAMEAQIIQLGAVRAR